MLRRAAAFALSVLLGAAALVVLPAPVLASPAPNAPVRSVAKAPKPPKPEVTKVKPARGPTSGGTKVTVKGEHLTGATKVTFGKLKGTKIKVKSDHKLTVVAPAQASGKVDVRVKTKGGKSKKGKNARFTYRLQPPTVTGMTASTGPYVGGTRVTLTGTDFEQVAAVTFGGTPGTDLSVLSPTQLAVTTPAHEEGTVPVAVTTSAGSAGAPSQFTFVAVPSAVTTPLPAGLSPAPGGGISLDYVSCSATPLCFAVGGVETVTGSYRPFVVRRTAPGAWAAAELPLPGDSAPVADASFWDLECASPTLCVAVGAYATPTQYRGLALTWNGSAWSPHAVTEPTAAEDQTSLHSVDCPTATTCVVIGGYVDDATGDRRPLALTYTGATWSAAVSPPLPPSTSEADLTGVSCLSATQCVAVGYRYETPSGDQLPYVVGLAGGVWQVATVGLPAGATASPQDAGLDAVSCVVDGPTGQCVAVGYYEDAAGDQAFVTRLATGSPSWVSTQVPLPGGAAADPNAELFAVECPTATDCRALGQYSPSGGGRQPLLTRVLAGVPTSQTGPTPSSTATPPAARPGALVCRAVDACRATGSYSLSPADDSGGYVQTLGPGGWTVAATPAPAGTIDAFVYGAAYLGTAGVYTGGYRTATGWNAMLLEIP